MLLLHELVGVGAALVAGSGPTRQRDARRPLTRADLHSKNDETAARVVADGGGMQAVIEATGLRTRENVVRLIDPAILKQALDNDVLEQAQPPPV